MSRITKAMVLAAGEGTRLRPLTLTTPKAMLPVGDKPLIAHIVGWLQKYGVVEIGINLHHFADQIVEYLGNGSRFGVKIVYSQEENLLGTAGGTKRLETLFAGDRFVVVYGDIFTDLDLGEMAAYHIKSEAMATIALFESPNPHEVGIVEVDECERILNFVEKPAPGTEKSNLANGGIYIVEPQILKYIQSSAYADFGFDVFPSMLRQGLPMYGYRLRRGEHLIDIGSIDNYWRANEDCLAGEGKQ